MSERAIKRLRRLVQLNELLSARQVMDIAAARAEKTAAEHDLEDLQGLLASDGIVSSSFSQVALRRAARSRQRHSEIEAERATLLGAAVETRAAGAAFKSRLETRIGQREKAAADMALQEVADRAARKWKSSV